MTYSKIHQRFSERLKNPDVLTNPGKYLGPNYQDVLNFWFYVDTLSDEEKKKMGQRYFALDDDVRDCAFLLLWMQPENLLVRILEMLLGVQLRMQLDGGFLVMQLMNLLHTINS
jgi:hypothetical protein